MSMGSSPDYYPAIVWPLDYNKSALCYVHAFSITAIHFCLGTGVPHLQALSQRGRGKGESLVHTDCACSGFSESAEDVLTSNVSHLKVVGINFAKV